MNLERKEIKLKKLKNKNIIFELIVILVVMSVGFVVNSYYVEKPNENKENYSDVFGKILNEKDLNVDGISTTSPSEITLGNQSWDGFKEKDTRILVTNEGLEITKHDDTPDERPVKGIPFYQEVGGAIIPLGETDSNGKLVIPKSKLITGESNLIEGLKPEGTPKGLDTKKEFKAKSTPIFVDPKIRFLGEVVGKDTDGLPTYQKIAKSIFTGDELTSITTNSSNVWLKYYTEFKNTEDKNAVHEKDKSQVYISKEPVIKGLTQEQMKKHNLFTGALVRANDKDNFYYKIRALNGSNTVLSKTADYTGDEVKEITQGSEWNNYILPLNKEHTYKLANYSWDNLNLNNTNNWVQNAKVRNSDDSIRTQAGGIADYRAMLTKVSCYEQACFEGEISGTDFITYKQLIHEITGKTLNEIKDSKDTGGIGIKLPEGIDSLKNTLADDRPTGGNWLKIYDAREGKTLYIAKKPLTSTVSWNSLYKAGVVYGPDVLNIVEENGKLVGKRNTDKLGKIIGSNEGEIKNLEYRGKIIEINGKNYIVRLLKAYNEDKNGGDPNTVGNTGYQNIINLKHSEWNRYILPLVKDYRYSDDSKNWLEEDLKKGGNGGYLGDKNYDIQLASYNWFGDLTLGTYSSNYPYKYNGENVNNYGGAGQYSWTQEYAESTKYRALRGSYSTYYGAAYSNSYYSYYRTDYYGFRPVLEEIN